jgi:iron complex outermembrane receptor protein
LNLGAKWDVPFLTGFTLTGRVMHTSKQFINAANTQDIPDWTRLGFGVCYMFSMYTHPVTLRATVENVLDDSYWESTAGLEGVDILGAPRTFLVSTSIDF